MKARYSLAAVLVSALTAFPASASVLSASGQAVGTRPTDRADYLRVTQVQDELNASTGRLADGAVASGALSSPVPAGDSDAGYLLQREGNGAGGSSGSGFVPVISKSSGGSDTDRLSLDGLGGRQNAGSINTFGSNGRGGRAGNNGGRGGHHGRGNGGHGGAQAAPEPSTWMLLGAGLAFLGGYAVLRRRQTILG